MDEDTERQRAARAALPPRYVVVLDAIDGGAADGDVAAMVGVDVSAVPLLVVVARAKLAEALVCAGENARP
ncbi:MAG TPA: hypothetical protein VM143_00675 [Acidimicrobiales bacterium]|nr:hypothetical protein [Acidimicrobiales bacterium]